MKPITLHPASVLAGLVLSGALFLAGAAPSHGTAQSIPTHDVRLVAEIPAEWWTYFTVNGSTSSSYTVPSDRRLVLTLVNGSVGGILANGENIGEALQAVNPPANPESFGTRVVIAPGTLVTAGSGQVADFWGYLEPVR